MPAATSHGRPVAAVLAGTSGAWAADVAAAGLAAPGSVTVNLIFASCSGATSILRSTGSQSWRPVLTSASPL